MISQLVTNVSTIFVLGEEPSITDLLKDKVVHKPQSPKNIPPNHLTIIALLYQRDGSIPKLSGSKIKLKLGLIFCTTSESTFEIICGTCN